MNFIWPTQAISPSLIGEPTGLAIDVGLANVGVAVFRLSNGECVAADALLTEGHTSRRSRQRYKGPKGRIRRRTHKVRDHSIHIIDDQIRRVYEVLDFITEYFLAARPLLIAIESPHGGAKSAKATWSMALALGSMLGTVRQWRHFEVCFDRPAPQLIVLSPRTCYQALRPGLKISKFDKRDTIKRTASACPDAGRLIERLKSWPLKEAAADAVQCGIAAMGNKIWDDCRSAARRIASCI